MSIKWLGAILIIAGCGGCGFSMAAGARREEHLLSQLDRVLSFMESELQYRLTPLPELCAMASKETDTSLGDIFIRFSRELSMQNAADAASCMSAALRCHENLSGRMRKHMRHLGRSLGRFDLPGQLQGLQAIRRACETDLGILRKNRDVRLRSYQTLGLCAGMALVILFA